MLACYAISVALNGFLPANLGTLVMLLMFTTIIAGVVLERYSAPTSSRRSSSRFIGAFTYLYLFLSVGGSFDIKFAFVHSHPWATAILLIGEPVPDLPAHPRVLAEGRPLVGRGQGGRRDPEASRASTSLRVFTPSLLGWIASLGVMAVFLAAYDIPVSFDTLMRICGGNSIANVTSVTPGGAGVNQAFNVASLNGITSATHGDRLLASRSSSSRPPGTFSSRSSCWSGSSAGRAAGELVETSYDDAKVKAAEQKASRAARKEAKREAKHGACLSRRGSRARLGLDRAPSWR